MSSEQSSTLAEPGYARSNREEKRVPWFLTNIDKALVPEASTTPKLSTRKILETYSKIPPQDVSRHVHEIRDKAWSLRSYPCTGLGIWLSPMISRSPAYTTILQRVREGATFMDVGSFVGYELRRLVLDGAPTTNLYGVDIVNHWDIGYDLFRDRDRFSVQFIEADILSAHPALLALNGKIDVMNLTHVIHQRNWNGQVEAAKTLCSFTRAGSMIVGCQMGNFAAQCPVLSAVNNIPQYRQNPKSFQRFWNQVGEETGTVWSCQAWLRTFEEMGWDPEDWRWVEDGARGLFS